MNDLSSLIKKHFPYISQTTLLDEISKHGKVVAIEKGTIILNVKSYIKEIPLVLTGALKVTREDELGHEILLYFIHSGQTCAMTLSSCMANNASKVKAIAEEDAEIVILPVERVYEWAQKHQQWKEFIMNTYHERFNELIHTIDSIAFTGLDKRLMEYLTAKTKMANSEMLNITHQIIANDLNSTREVISRILKKLENEGKILLGRNKIELM